MTIQEMHDFFNFMVDKYDAPYYTGDEIDMVINQSQMDYVNEIIFNRADKGNASIVLSDLELSQQASFLLRPIINSKTVTTNTNSFIPWEDIVTTPDDDLMYVLALGDANGNDVKYVRQNDRFRFNRNYFKAADSDNFQYTITDSGMKLSPDASTSEVNIRVRWIKKPTDVDLNSSTDCELPSATHNKIIARAIAIAGIATDQQASMALDQTTN